MDTEGDGERQAQLMDELNRLSSRTYRKIKSWKWLLRSDALAERIRSKKRYSELD